MSKGNVKYGDRLSDEQHVVRYCRKNTWKQRHDGEITIKPSAFRSGTHPDKGISAFWLEYFGRNERYSLKRIRKTSTYQGFDEYGKFVKLNVGDIKKVGLEQIGVHLKAVYTGRPPNNSHTDICPPGPAIFNALALCAERHGTLLDVPVLES